MRNFKQLRVDANLRQTDIAESMQITVQTVNKWERGRSPIARRHWNALARLFGVSVDELEAALVETMLESCIEHKNTDAMKNAVISGLYKVELIQDALRRYNLYCYEHQMPEQKDFERERLDFEREIFERDKRIFELEQQVEALRKELERSRPAASLSSALKLKPTETEVSK